MRTEEFISSISQLASNDGEFEKVRLGMPIGWDMTGNIVVAQKRTEMITLRHTCVTGAKRVAYISRLLVTLSCLYDKDEVSFFVLSPRKEYAGLLGLNCLDSVIPYVQSKEDLLSAKAALRDLAYMYGDNKKRARLILVLDGLEELPNANERGELWEYREIFDLMSRIPNVDVISGLDLKKSIFSGCPGAFVGIENCLISLRDDGKADVTYVNDDTKLSAPILMDCPNDTDLGETISFLNAVFNGAEGSV